MKKTKSILDFYITPFFGGVFALSIICFLWKVESFQKGILIVVIGAAIFSVILGSLLLVANKYLRPKIQKYYLYHKNIKSLEYIGLKYNKTMNCYFGTFREYDVQVICHFEILDLLTTEYVINVFFEKIDINKLKEIQKINISDKAKIAEYLIQKTYRFKWTPPSKEELTSSVNGLIDYLEEKKLDPIRLEKLEKEF